MITTKMLEKDLQISNFAMLLINSNEFAILVLRQVQMDVNNLANLNG